MRILMTPGDINKQINDLWGKFMDFGHVARVVMTDARERDLIAIETSAALLDDMARALRSRAAEQRDEADKRGGKETGIYHECPNCGVPRFQHGTILEKCANCGDDETDFSLTPEVP